VDVTDYRLLITFFTGGKVVLNFEKG
jgi:hypothetical protein